MLVCVPALGLRGELGDLLLVEAADLPGPLGALGVGGVARGLVLALLLHLSPTLSHIILVPLEHLELKILCLVKILLTSTSWGCCTVSHSDSYSVEQTWAEQCVNISYNRELNSIFSQNQVFLLNFPGGKDHLEF